MPCTAVPNFGRCENCRVDPHLENSYLSNASTMGQGLPCILTATYNARQMIGSRLSNPRQTQTSKLTSLPVLVTRDRAPAALTQATSDESGSELALVATHVAHLRSPIFGLQRPSVEPCETFRHGNSGEEKIFRCRQTYGMQILVRTRAKIRIIQLAPQRPISEHGFDRATPQRTRSRSPPPLHPPM